MNGVLEEKKEKTLENDLKEEEWMKKPRDEMTEDEIQKFDAFTENKERLRQDQEKLKKILNQELKKFMMDIKKICEEFDNHLDYLFMKRLEYQYRVYEQEVILLKIEQNLHEEELMNKNMDFIQKSHNELEERLDNKKMILDKISHKIREIENEREILEGDVVKIETKILKQIIQGIVIPKEEQIHKKTDGGDEHIDSYIKEKRLFLPPVNHPEHSIEKAFMLKSLLKDPQYYYSKVREFLQKKYENEPEINAEWNRFVKLFSVRILIKNKNKQISNIRKIIQKMEKGVKSQQTDLTTLQEKQTEIEKHMEKSVYNSFLMFRSNSINIEVPTNKAIFFKSDTILINREEIEKLNKKITNLGNQKVGLLIKNLEEKSKVESELEDLKMLELEVRLSIIETFVLTRLKVSKKLQTLISKKDDKIMETEEKNLKKQIDKLITSTEKMIGIYKKKELAMKKEINFLTKENDELLHHGGKLQESVSQRQEIFDMVFGKINDEENNENVKTGNLESKFDQKTYGKTIDLIQNRKLYDTAKFLAKEIENLMKELRTLQKRTFPNLG